MTMQKEQKYAGLFAKVRALYAKRLKEADYKRLSGAGSLSDLVTALKRYPSWAEAMSSVDELNVRRGYLESVLRRAFFHEFDRLMRFVPDHDKEIMGFIVERTEIELILSFLRLLSLNRLEDFSADLPPHFSKRSSLNLPALQTAKSYQEMLTAIRKTKYYGTLTRLAPTDDGSLDYNTIETVLWQLYYENLFSIIKKNYSGETRKLLFELIGSRVDIENISRVIRIKKSFPVPENDLFVYLMRVSYKIKQDFLRELFNTQSDEEMIALLQRSKYRKVFRNMDISHIKVYSQDFMVGKCRRAIFHAPPSVYLSVVYLILKEAELTNLVRIIESIRYGVVPENIFL